MTQFLSSALVFLEHILNGGLVNHQVRPPIVTDDLDARLVVPLDDAMHFFAVAHPHDHGRSRLHLLLIVEIFRVGLLRRRRFSSPSRSRPVVTTVWPLKPPLWPVVAIVSVPALRPLHVVGVVIGIVIVIVIDARQSRTDQLAVGEILLVTRLLGRSRSHGFFHSGATPAHALAQTALFEGPEKSIYEGVKISLTVPQEGSRDNAAFVPRVCQILHIRTFPMPSCRAEPLL